jgi:hypothetical protein
VSTVADLEPAFPLHWVHHASVVDARTAFASGLQRLLDNGVDVVTVTTSDLHKADFVEAALVAVRDAHVGYGGSRERIVLERGDPAREESADPDPAVAGAVFTRAFGEALAAHLAQRDDGSVDDALRALVADGWTSCRIGATTTLRVEDRR